MVALTDLRTRDRRLFMAMAAEAGADADDILAEVLASYATLVRDAPAALPRDRLAGLALKTRGGGAACLNSTQRGPRPFRFTSAAR